MNNTITKSAIAGLIVFGLSDNATSADIAPLNTALTLAQIEASDGKRHTMLVQKDTGRSVVAVNLSQHFSYFPDDPLNVVEKQGYKNIVEITTTLAKVTLDYQQLLPAGGTATQHIAAGTNYKEHGVEANINEVFLFPKYAQATPNTSVIQWQSNVLLDYEVELCIRWSKTIHQPQIAEQSYAGLFICGDFTDRAKLLRKIDIDNVTSGHGFSDAKSGEGLFPTGPYIVVPNDWQSFVPSLTLSTYVNGKQRQQGQASEMIKSPQQLVNWILQEGEKPKWKYNEQAVPLIHDSVIRKGQNLVTGTPEGVIYNTPGLSYRIGKSLKWLATFSFLNSGPVEYILEQYIAEGFEEKLFLQSGDKVQLTGTFLGTIEVDIVE